MMTNKPTLGLYLHVPFCAAKCRYCDFYSAAAPRARQQAYVAALVRDLIARAKTAEGYVVDTVYLGGGTPSLLPPSDIALLLGTLRGHYDLAEDAEITMECNPHSAKTGDFEALLQAGVNRLSIGLQSAIDTELAALGRPHDFADFEKTFCAARAAGFSNISVDVMFGIPHQTVKSLEKTLAAVVSLAPEHMSAYGLRVEEGTPFWRERHTLPIADEDTVADMQLLVARVLGEAGYEHYEVSNYARGGYRSRHNMRYWLGQEYLGFGPAAHSYFDGVRFEAPRDTAQYIRAVEAGDKETLCQNARRLTPHEVQEEYVMLRMRLFEGIDEADFQARFGVSLEDAVGDLSRLADGGFLTRREGRMAFTERGMYVSNAILSEWLDFRA